LGERRKTKGRIGGFDCEVKKFPFSTKPIEYVENETPRMF